MPEVPADWRRGFTNLARDYGPTPVSVHGQLPAELRGTAYRSGVGLIDGAGGRYPHWFDADGGVSAMRFEEGRAVAAAKVVDTRWLRRERQAGRRLYGGYGTPLARPWHEVFAGDVKNPCNTNCFAMRDRVYALCEPGPPLEIDPETLSTIGEETFGVVSRGFAAHPHEVVGRRAYYNIGLKPGRHSTLEVFELPFEGPVRLLLSVAVPGTVLVHDCGVSERFLVVALAPLRLKLWPFLTKRAGLVQALEFRAREGTELLVVPLNNPAQYFRVKTDAFYTEHIANAFDDGETLTFDCTWYDDLAAMQRFISGLGNGVVGDMLGSRLRRWQLHLPSRRARVETVWQNGIELPLVAPVVRGRAHRFVYVVGHSSGALAKTALWDSVFKIDVHTGKAEVFTSEPGCNVSEPLLVQRGAGEEDVWVITQVYDAPENRSYEAVLDGRALGAGPVARAYFPVAMPPRVHGSFAPRP